MIYLGSDHAGFDLKEQAIKYLTDHAIAFEDLGDKAPVPDDDYPDYGFAVAQKVAAGGQGMLFCESAGGMTICANKVKGIRAVECSTEAEVQHAREQNNANILVLSRMAVTADHLPALLSTWLTSAYTEEARHARRLAKIATFEDEHWH